MIGALVGFMVSGWGAAWAEGIPSTGYLGGAIGCVILGLALRRHGARGKAGSLALAWGICGGSLAGLDLVLRVVLAERLFVNEQQALQSRWPPMEEVSRYEPLARFDREVVGNLATLLGPGPLDRRRRVVFTVDEHGFRNPPGSAKGPIDLLLLGDSFVAGAGIDDAGAVAGRLRAAGVGRVYNLGQGGAGPWQELMALLTMLPELEAAPGARLVWVLFTGNDLLDRSEDWLEPRLRGEWGRWRTRFDTFRARSPARLLAKAVEAARSPTPPRSLVTRCESPKGPVLSFVPDSEELRRSRSELEARPGTRRLAEVLARGMRAARERGFAPVLAIAPTKEEVLGLVPVPSPVEEVLAGACEAAGGGALRLREVLGAAQGLPYWEDDTHWNEEGSALVAAALAR